MIPLDQSYENEIFLSYEEKEMIDGILNDAKLVNLRKRGFGGSEIDFSESDDIGELLCKVSPRKRPRKRTPDSGTDIEVEVSEEELVTAMANDLALSGSGNVTLLDEQTVPEADEDARTDEAVSNDEMHVQTRDDSGSNLAKPELSPTLQERMTKQRAEQVSFLKNKGLIKDESNLREGAGQSGSEDDAHDEAVTNGEMHVRTSDDDSSDIVKPEQSPTLQERMAKQRAEQVSFLKNKGLINDESNLSEGAGSPKMASADSTDAKNSSQDPQAKTEDMEDEYEEDHLPVVWDWKRLYGTADIHTVTWESKMLSNLCHIVENMALEVSSQATKVALQYSVIGAIVSAVAIPSALVTASKLIDDPYQISTSIFFLAVTCFRLKDAILTHLTT